MIKLVDFIRILSLSENNFKLKLEEGVFFLHSETEERAKQDTKSAYHLWKYFPEKYELFNRTHNRYKGKEKKVEIDFIQKQTKWIMSFVRYPEHQDKGVQTFLFHISQERPY